MKSGKIIKNNGFLYAGYVLLRDGYGLLKDFLYLADRQFLYFLFKKDGLADKLKNFDKLNVGCGDDLIRGWLNIGLWRDKAYGDIIVKNGASVLNFDMTKDLPVAENSVQYVYASHFIEHLTFREGIAALQKCHKAMRKGGVIRLTFPDMELWINNYYENDLRFFEKYKLLHIHDGTPAETKGEIFMFQVHGWGHKWNYDFASMKHILENAGFSQVSRRKVFESLVPEIREIEPGNEGRLMETAYVEAVK